MWLVKDKIFYIEQFLSDYEIELLDAAIEESSDAVISEYKEKTADPTFGGYLTVKFPNRDLMDSIVGRMFKVVKDNDLNYQQFYPRDELQFIGPGCAMSIHVDGDGTNVGYGLVLYISDPETYSGGEIFYPDYDISIKPARGSLAIHAGNVPHGVKEVTDGYRFVIIAFTGVGG